MMYSKGFELIELMIVVAIIGILASVVVPAYQTYQKESECKNGNLASCEALNVKMEVTKETFGRFTCDNKFETVWVKATGNKLIPMDGRHSISESGRMKWFVDNKINTYMIPDGVYCKYEEKIVKKDIDTPATTPIPREVTYNGE